MNRLLSVPLLLSTCALCFFAGYKFGKESHPPVAIVAETIIEEAPAQQLSDIVEQPPLPTVFPQDEPVQNSFEFRAKETIQTFFDKNERKLVAQILEIKEDSLKIRRQADGQELELPVNMLSSEDQAFAAYLWEQQPKKSPPTASTKSMEDTLWDELFK